VNLDSLSCEFTFAFCTIIMDGEGIDGPNAPEDLEERR
jgi:hypothetical protein